jgi:cytochrome c-type biogenesis protein CcmH/NrfF
VILVIRISYYLTLIIHTSLKTIASNIANQQLVHSTFRSDWIDTPGNNCANENHGFRGIYDGEWFSQLSAVTSDLSCYPQCDYKSVAISTATAKRARYEFHWKREADAVSTSGPLRCRQCLGMALATAAAGLALPPLG